MIKPKRNTNLEIDIKYGWNEYTYNISDDDENLEQSPSKLGYSENYFDSSTLSMKDIQWAKYSFSAYFKEIVWFSKEL